MFLLSFSPILLILILIFLFKKALYKIMPLVFLYASILAFFIWQIKTEYYALSLARGFLIAFDILIIVFGAIFFLEFLKNNKIIDYIKEKIVNISSDIRVQLILIVWFFGSFIEGVAGFGTPATITAPLLLILGIKPVLAVAIALIGNSTAVAFGAVGTPIRIGFNTVDPGLIEAIVLNAGIINLIAGSLVPLILISVFISSREKWSFKEIKEIIPWSIFAGLAFTIPYFISSLFAYEFPSILGALTGMAIIITSLKYKFLLPKNIIQLKTSSIKQESKISKTKAFTPYVLLILFLIIGKLTLPSISINLLNISKYSFNTFNPGLAFIMSIIFFSLIYKTKISTIRKSAIKASKSLKAPFIAILFIVSLVQLMIQSSYNSSNLDGMINIIASIISPSLHLFLAPIIGAFGAFMAGSATVSNILFTDLHTLTNQLTNYPLSLILALQLTGAAVGNIIALTNMVSAQSTVGIKGRELDIIKKSFIPFTIYLSLIIIIAYFLYIIS